MQATGPAMETDGEGQRTTVVAAPLWLVGGLLLVAVAWPLAWFGPPLLREHTFFPLWLGYILVVDGLTFRRTGSSLLSQSPARFGLLFVFSIPLWWLFEVANRFLDNWRYVVSRPIPAIDYAVRASIAFSTVMPALFVTARLWRTAPFFRRPIIWLKIAPSRSALAVIALTGAIMFTGSLAFPRYLFPLVWLGLFFLFDPLNARRGDPSLAAEVARGRWDTVVVLGAAGLTCGFFWEMWNILAMPKWVYDVPFVGGAKLFEMPALGYGGYIPFALEIYAAYHLLHRLVLRRPDHHLGIAAPLPPSGRREGKRDAL